MITSWVLVVFMSYDRSGSMTTIQNLKSIEECNRVAKVIKDWRGNFIVSAKCIEVIHKNK